MVRLTPAQLWWQLFVKTGSVFCYLMYKRLTIQ